MVLLLTRRVEELATVQPAKREQQNDQKECWRKTQAAVELLKVTQNVCNRQELASLRQDGAFPSDGQHWRKKGRNYEYNIPACEVAIAEWKSMTPDQQKQIKLSMVA